MSGLELPERAIREQIASAIQVVIQVVRFSDGSRKIASVSEITGMEGDTIVMQDIFAYKRKGVAADGTILGDFSPTGVRPRFIDKFKVSGIDVSGHIFEVTEG